MRPINALRITLFGSLAVAACAVAPHALADGHQANLGSAVDVGGGDRWTVSGLKPSADVIPYAPAGSLWEATATNQLADGGIPVVPGFAAGNGAQTYPVLWGVASAQGINPGSLAPGGSATGKLYFDVTGATPTSVSYAIDGNQVAVWVQPPPPPPAASAPGYTAPPAAAPAAPAPAAAGSSGTPVPAGAGSSGTPLPADTGSSGTPLPDEGSSGTPLPAESSPSTTETPSAAPTTAAAPTATSPAMTSPAAATPAPSTAATATATATPGS